MRSKWIFFDVMGVIFTVGDDTNDLLVPFIQKKNGNISREYINKKYLSASLGEITSEEFWKSMNIVPNGLEKELEEEYLDSCLTIDENFLEVVKKISTKYHIGIISNDVSEWSVFLRKKFNLNEFVEICIISGDAHCRKPDAKIYQKALEISGADPKDCTFIDDRDKNLIPAQQLGFNIIRFLRDDLKTTISDMVCISDFKELIKVV